MSKHVCREGQDCTCCHAAMEPEETCPVHGTGLCQPRCVECGRFVAREMLEDPNEWGEE